MVMVHVYGIILDCITTWLDSIVKSMAFDDLLPKWGAVIWLTKCLDQCLKAWGLTHWSLGDLNEIFGEVIFKLIALIDEVSLVKLPKDECHLIHEKSALFQVMAWCHQATSHYLSKCWPRSLSPYGVTRPQWVNSSSSLVQNQRW